jgi:hypothetical protein
VCAALSSWMRNEKERVVRREVKAGRRKPAPARFLARTKMQSGCQRSIKQLQACIVPVIQVKNRTIRINHGIQGLAVYAEMAYRMSS